MDSRVEHEDDEWGKCRDGLGEVWDGGRNPSLKDSVIIFLRHFIKRSTLSKISKTLIITIQYWGFNK